MSICENCAGKGLVSSGANPQDLEAGNKLTCPECNGSGNVGAAGNDGPQEEAPESPKAEAPSSENAGGEESGEQSPIVPKVGDACLTADDEPGTLQAEGDGFVCVAN